MNSKYLLDSLSILIRNSIITLMPEDWISHRYWDFISDYQNISCWGFDFKVLSETMTEGFDVKKIDRVYNEILVPKITRFAKELKRSRVQITDNTHCNKARNLMKELFNDTIG